MRRLRRQVQASPACRYSKAQAPATPPRGKPSLCPPGKAWWPYYGLMVLVGLLSRCGPGWRRGVVQAVEDGKGLVPGAAGGLSRGRRRGGRRRGGAGFRRCRDGEDEDEVSPCLAERVGGLLAQVQCLQQMGAGGLPRLGAASLPAEVGGAVRCGQRGVLGSDPVLPVSLLVEEGRQVRWKLPGMAPEAVFGRLRAVAASKTGSGHGRQTGPAGTR
jgi:hypothetical protein